MTYCIAMRLKEGIVGLADTLITSGALSIFMLALSIA